MTSTTPIDVTLTTTLPPAVTTSNAPLPPGQDPWYLYPPSGWQSKQPGDILAVRQAPGNTTGVVNAAKAWNIMYRTTNSHYQPQYAVTTLFQPNSISSLRTLISFQDYYDSSDVNASPSYTIMTDSTLQLQTYIYLSQGWFVVLPDYEGPLASFGAGVMSGHAVLDSIRAVLNGGAAQFGLPAETQYAMYGYSGGALATEWAAELQVQYAPELNFTGVAFGGVTPNLTSVFHTLSNSDTGYTSKLTSAILGLCNEFWSETRPTIMRLLGVPTWYAATVKINAMGTGKNMADLQSFVAELLGLPVTMDIIHSDGIMGYHGVPQMPLFIHRGLLDEISPTSDTDALVNEYCNMGATIYYHKNPDTDHYDEGVQGFGGAFQWIRSVFEGNVTEAEGCQFPAPAPW